ncbi:16S rRNA (uracil(1498)-N(3))-methyltransferase [Baaleninema simplex]|uniref:16S rRNA (uracil(1498)-N(3))-methyltransferase n=1 Tax=Baaleninema simplex TaxID=2862350 RepID=UPI0008FBE1AB
MAANATLFFGTPLFSQTIVPSGFRLPCHPLRDTGCQLVSLGRRVLRAVTAPVFALSVVAAVWETQ